MLTEPEPTPDWEDDWLASMSDDEPTPADVRYDWQTMRYRHIKNAAAYSAAVREWLRLEPNPQIREMFGV